MDNYITFNEEAHSYTDPQGIPYTSVTRLLGTLSTPFNAEMIAGMVAKKRKRVCEGMSKEEIAKKFDEHARGTTVEEVLAEWDDKRDEANAHGNRIHNALEDYDNSLGIKDLELKPLIVSLANEFKGYKKTIVEPTLYSKENFVAGKADKLVFRTKTRVDYFDYKTNVIKMDSSSIDQYTGEKKWNNKYMLGPVSHLEDCNFNKYALQLSTYAWLGEQTYGYKPGRLAIINIDKEFNYKFIPVPYMKMEVEAIMKANEKNIVVQTALQNADEDGSF